MTINYRIAGILALAILCPTKTLEAVEIYAFTDARGVLHLTDRPRDARYRPLRPKQSGFFLVRAKPRPRTPFNTIIQDASRRFGLDRSLLRAVIQAESDFNPNAVSSAGAVGLMQLMPRTALQYGVRNLTDPEANIHAGAQHLRGLLTRFNNNLTLSLAAYNAGEGAVANYGNQVPPYPETKQYVDRVLRFYKQFRNAM